MQAAELRAVLLFHGNVASLLWHPHIPETLLVKCEGEQYSGLVFVWDPLSEGPRSVNFGQHLPGAQAGGKPRTLWLGFDTSSPPLLFFSDAQNYVLACLGETDQGPAPWGAAEFHGPGLAAERHEQCEESPLHLVPASGTRPDVPDMEDDDDDSELEDTFVHKR